MRAATLTVHAAAGLARCADQQTVRLLRASGGLCRSALAVLPSAPPATSPQQPRASRPDDAPRRRRRPRGKRGNRGQKDTVKEKDHAEPDASDNAAATSLSLGSSPAALVLQGSTPAFGVAARAASWPALPAGDALAAYESDLDDEWADTPESATTLEGRKRGKGTGSALADVAAVAVGPAHSIPDHPLNDVAFFDRMAILENPLGRSMGEDSTANEPFLEFFAARDEKGLLSLFQKVVAYQPRYRGDLDWLQFSALIMERIGHAKK